MTADWFDALARARAHSPFLSVAMDNLPDLVALLEAGDAKAALAYARAAGEGVDDLGVALRRERRALALALAIGDLAGAFPLLRVTHELSAFADRAKYLGDPDFVEVPVRGLLSPAYLASRRAEVPAERARHDNEVGAGDAFRYEPSETTHLSMIDRDGNAVSSTQTVNVWMGAAVVAPGTGVLLNNEMDDFSIQEGVPNMFGAVGARANAIAPGKTPLSSMSPTLLLKNNQVRMAVGAPGGTRIISCTAQTILNYIEYGLPLYDAVASIRYHHQWKPDVLILEPPGPGEKVAHRLRRA